MNCPSCDSEKFREAEIGLTGERNGERYSVQVAGWRCEHCAFETVDSQQSAELTRALSDAYRMAHGLLTSGQIRERRNALGMTQQEFADYLKVGVASVKRWELGQIQDRAMDELIKLKTNLQAAKRSLTALDERLCGHHQVRGRIVEFVAVAEDIRYEPAAPLTIVVRQERSELLGVDPTRIAA